ncbi:hypothetical protein DP939_28540 [Spongiactinospora rosea]|uniref:Uncharacterized protein n=1 Tax=Spongiactinospora rosea TaxID=2248750 RepID=A0A366LTK8_9ACTN|nr:hypothetical protein DP939_28540 [Spongiactinospora rosea]
MQVSLLAAAFDPDLPAMDFSVLAGAAGARRVIPRRLLLTGPYPGWTCDAQLLVGASRATYDRQPSRKVRACWATGSGAIQNAE